MTELKRYDYEELECWKSKIKLSLATFLTLLKAICWPPPMSDTSSLRCSRKVLIFEYNHGGMAT